MKKKRLIRKCKRLFFPFGEICLVLLAVLFMLSFSHLTCFVGELADRLASGISLAWIAGVVIIIITSEACNTRFRAQWKFQAVYYVMMTVLYYILAVFLISEWNWYMCIPALVCLWRCLLPFRWLA